MKLTKRSTISELIEKYNSERKLSRSYYLQLLNLADALSTAANGDTRCGDVFKPSVINKVIEREDYTPTTLAQFRSRFFTLSTYATKNGVMGKVKRAGVNKIVWRPDGPVPDPALTLSVFDLVDHYALANELAFEYRKSLRYSAGIGAVIQLRFTDIVGNIITFRAETRKGNRFPKVKAIPDWVLDDIEPIRKPERDWVRV